MHVLPSLTQRPALWLVAINTSNRANKVGCLSANVLVWPSFWPNSLELGRHLSLGLNNQLCGVASPGIAYVTVQWDWLTGWHWCSLCWVDTGFFLCVSSSARFWQPEVSLIWLFWHCSLWNSEGKKSTGPWSSFQTNKISGLRVFQFSSAKNKGLWNNLSSSLIDWCDALFGHKI